MNRSKDLPYYDYRRYKNATAQVTSEQGVRTVAKIKYGIVHFKIKRALLTEKSPGNQQKDGFINKHREIVPVKNMVSNAASDDTRNCKKNQNPQFPTDAHPRYLLQRTHLSWILQSTSK